ncbi:MAG TPA: MFS transporter [Thermaerobacter sp.]
MARRAPRHHLFILYLTIFLTVAGFGIVIPVLPYFARELGAGSVEMGLMVSLYAMAQFLFAPFWGALSDRVGRKPVLILGMTGFALSFGAMAFVHTVPSLILVRFLGGMLSASTFPSAQALVADLTPPEERGPALAWMGGVSNLGFMLGPLLGMPLTALGYGFRGLALTGGLAILITAVLALLVLPGIRSRPDLRRPRIPLTRAFVLAATSPEAPCYWLVLISSFAGSSIFSMLGYYLMDRLGAPETANQLAFSMMGVTSALVQFSVVGAAIRRWGEVSTATAGLVTGIAAFLCLLLARSVPMVVLAVGVWGVALALLRPPLTSLVSRRTVLGQGTAMGIQSAFESLGRVLGPSVAGALFSLHVLAPYTAVTIILTLALWIGSRRLRALERVSSAAQA